MADGFIESMRADADGGPSEIEFSHIDGVQGRIPGLLATGEDIVIGDGIAVKGILGHIILGIHHIFNALIIGMLGVYGKKHIFIAVRHFPES